MTGMNSDKTTKLMSMSRNEFIHSFKKFAPDYRGPLAASRFDLKHKSGSVTIEIEELPKRTLGGLLALPQSSITLTMTGLSKDERQKFLERFDISFQRGGG